MADFSKLNLADGDRHERRRQERWYALRVRPKGEAMVATLLRHKGYQEYVPKQRVRRKWSDRTKLLETPIFSGYVFLYCSWGEGVPIVTTPGVIGVAGLGRSPAAIPDEEIEWIRQLEHSQLPLRAWPFPRVGERVAVINGPLRGVCGTLVSSDDTDQLVVSVDLLQRAVAVKLEREWIARA